MRASSQDRNVPTGCSWLMFFSLGRLAFLRHATIELVFGLQPIIKLTAWKAAAFEIDFICAEPDLFKTWSVVCGSDLWVRLNRACPDLRPFTLFVPALRCHIDPNPFPASLNCSSAVVA